MVDLRLISLLSVIASSVLVAHDIQSDPASILLSNGVNYDYEVITPEANETEIETTPYVQNSEEHKPVKPETVVIVAIFVLLLFIVVATGGIVFYCWKTRKMMLAASCHPSSVASIASRLKMDETGYYNNNDQGISDQTVVYDEYGGFYDERGCYIDNEGNVYAPVGAEVWYDEEGNAHFDFDQKPPQQEPQPSDLDVAIHALEELKLSAEKSLQEMKTKRSHTWLKLVNGFITYASDSLEEIRSLENTDVDKETSDFFQHFSEKLIQIRDYIESVTLEREESIVEDTTNFEDKPTTGDAKTEDKKMKLTEREKIRIRREHAEELASLGPNHRRLREEELGLKTIRKPRIIQLNGVTTIAAPGGTCFLMPYLLRDRYPGYVRDIEEIEGSYDPALRHINPPIPLSQRGTKPYPKPYIGEFPKSKK